MARPVKARRPTQHLIVLSRLARSIEVDERLEPRRKKRLMRMIAQLIGELQKELSR